MAKTQEDFTQDFTKAMTGMMNAFPPDPAALAETFKTSAMLGEKMSKVTLEAIEKSAEISSKWTKDAITRMSDLTRINNESTDFTKSMTDLASVSTEIATENLAAFAEITKRMQMDAVELLLAVGQGMSENAATAVKKSSAEVTGTVKKTAAAK